MKDNIPAIQKMAIDRINQVIEQHGYYQPRSDGDTPAYERALINILVDLIHAANAEELNIAEIIPLSITVAYDELLQK